MRQNLKAYSKKYEMADDFIESLCGFFDMASCVWLLAFGDTVHSFTNVRYDDRANGTQYSPAADRRSWRALTDFLDELFPHRPGAAGSADT